MKYVIMIIRIVFLSFIWVITSYNCLGQTNNPLHQKELSSGNLYGKPFRTVISGVVWDSSTTIAVTIKDPLNYYDSENYEKYTHKVPVINGRFHLTTKIAHPMYVYFKNVHLFGAFNSIAANRYRDPFIIEPGDSIHVDTRVYSGYFNNIIFSGRGVEKLWCIQELINKTRLFDNPLLKDNINRRGLVDTIQNVLLSSFAAYEGKISVGAASIIKANFIPMLATDISDFLIFQSMDLSKKMVQNIFRNGLIYSERIINSNSPFLVYAFFFRTILKKRMLLLYSISSQTNYDSVAYCFNKEFFDFCWEKLSNNKKLREVILGEYLQKAFLRNMFNSDLEKSSIKYTSNIDKKSPFHALVKSLSNIYKLKLGRGMPAYQFQFMDTAGNLVKMKDFKGKVVLIDFMYNGCVGCAHLVPFLQQIKKQFLGRNVVFISISIDDTIEQWKKGIGKYSTAGSIQLKVDHGGHENEIIKYYNITAYPSLVLIDKAGRIVTPNAPNPRVDNGKALIRLINEILNYN